MKNRYVLKTIIIFFFSSFLVYCGFKTINFFKINKKTVNSFMQTASFVKEKNIQNIKLIRLEIEVFDDIHSKEGKIQDVQLNNHKLSLSPREAQGNRGSFYFQLSPGLYILKWKVKRHKYIWPRYLQYKKQIRISLNNFSVYIKIKGENITIS